MVPFFAFLKASVPVLMGLQSSHNVRDGIIAQEEPCLLSGNCDYYSPAHERELGEAFGQRRSQKSPREFAVLNVPVQSLPLLAAGVCTRERMNASHKTIYEINAANTFQQHKNGTHS
jgi:hypothetical protein